MVSFPIDIAGDCPFGLGNIPFGIFSIIGEPQEQSQKRAATAVGNFVLDLHLLVEHGIFDKTGLETHLGDVFLKPNLNSFATLPASQRSLVRSMIIKELSTESSILFKNTDLNSKAFIPLDQVQMHIPMAITDYTDFFSSFTHADNARRPYGLKVPPAFYHYPMAYNGRISSIVVSGTDVVRPRGFFPTEDSTFPTYQASQQIDFELELGCFISKPVESGKTVTAETAVDHVFGYVLLNDWSARDIQKYEMAPLGPFHSKSFLTSISPWVVTLDALRSGQGPPPKSNSSSISPNLLCRKELHGLFDIQFLGKLSRGKDQNVVIARSNYSDAHWTSFQTIAYQSSSGCGMHTGDLLASGTNSSPAPKDVDTSEPRVSTFGCLAENKHVGHKLPNVGGRPVTWLEDGDRFSLEGWFKTADGGRAGFGSVTALILPARND